MGLHCSSSSHVKQRTAQVYGYIIHRSLRLFTDPLELILYHTLQNVVLESLDGFCDRALADKKSRSSTKPIEHSKALFCGNQARDN